MPKLRSFARSEGSWVSSVWERMDQIWCIEAEDSLISSLQQHLYRLQVGMSVLYLRLGTAEPRLIYLTLTSQGSALVNCVCGAYSDLIQIQLTWSMRPGDTSAWKCCGRQTQEIWKSASLLGADILDSKTVMLTCPWNRSGIHLKSCTNVRVRPVALFTVLLLFSVLFLHSEMCSVVFLGGSTRVKY